MTIDYTADFLMPQGIYGLSHAVGPIPTAAKQAIQNNYLDHWQYLGGDAWPHWLAEINVFSQRIAKLINTKHSNICPQTNLASGFSAVLSALSKLPTHARKKSIVMHQDAFASMGFVVNAMRKTYGLNLVIINGDPNDTEIWTKAFEKNSVLACLITHVHSNTSIASNVRALCNAAQQFDVFALVDIAQSVGVLPIDVTRWNADAVFGSCVKWLCGGPGAGFLYVKDTLLCSLEPDQVGWFSHINPFEFDINHFVFANTALKFWGGTPSVVPFVTAAASIDLLQSIGIENIVTHNRQLKKVLLSCLPQGHPSKHLIDEYKIQGGSLCLLTSDHARTIELLNDKQVKFDQRGDVIRISLHIMNTQKEAEIIASCFV